MSPPSERELRVQLENTLYDVMYTKTLLEDNTKSAKEHLHNWELRAMSGMTAEEIDAVRDRVNRSFKR